MKDITPESLKAFFSTPSQAEVEKAAGLAQGYLTKIIKGQKPLTKKTIEKLKPILKKHHF